MLIIFKSLRNSFWYELRDVILFRWNIRVKKYFEIKEYDLNKYPVVFSKTYFKNKWNYNSRYPTEYINQFKWLLF